MKHYHDLEKDEMVYDENLHYNIVKFEGWTYNVGFRAGAYLQYEDWEMTFRFELGYLWGFTEHFFVGIAFKTVLSFNNEEGDEYRGKNMPADDVPLNTKSFGLVIKVVRKQGLGI